MESSSNGIERIGTDDPRSSKIVKHNGVVYLSGQVGDVNNVEADVTEQTKATLAKIDDLLAQAGTNKSNLLTAQIWVKDIQKDFVAMNAVWNAWIDPNNKPTRACVEARLARDHLLVEV